MEQKNTNRDFEYLMYLAQENNKEIEGALNFAADGIGKFACNDKFTVLYYNDKLANMVGIERGELEEQNFNSSIYINKEDLPNLLQEVKAAQKDKKPLSLQYRLKHKDGHDVWVKVNGIFTEELFEDKYPIVYFIYTDITPFVLTQKQFQSEIDYHNAVQSENLVAKLKINLSKNQVESYWAKEEFDLELNGIVFTQAMLRLADTAVTTEERQGILNMLNITHILQIYEAGEKEETIEYQRKTKKGIIWAQMSFKVHSNPDSGNIMCFLYTYDISEQRTSREMIDSVVNLDYDYIALLDLANNDYSIYSKREWGTSPLPPFHTSNYEEEVQSYAREYLAPEDVERNIREMSVENIKKELSDKDVFVSYCTVRDYNGQNRRKKLKFSYLNRVNQQILITRVDITDIYEKEQRQNEELKNALFAAQQANQAKTEFLSRMSHEIRTPMNAIIGMSTLAAQCVSDPQQVSDYLSKVGISARFLLSLINDILDMSRIESGKTVVKNEKIPFQNFLDGINTICYEQALNKEIDYDIVIASYVEDYYIGDAMKLQQVLLNLLSNAIKFTGKGGRVQLVISQEKLTANKAHMKFVVTDTGVGISERFLPHIFEPFEQQHTGTTSMYSGTGLGLAICKNLLSLMGGKINVTSIEGVGSEFTVELPLKICEEHGKAGQLKSEIKFPAMNVLIVDDDILICNHTKQILTNMGMKACWVESGKKAIEMVSDKLSRKEYYDVIFIDWKMPDMDGIETTRQIRKIVGPDVTIIILTAYDWVAIEQEAKASGANLLISKPLFEASVTSAFQKIYHEKHEKSGIVVQTKEYDFTGKRTLLVEDHMLNIEVAKKLLMAKNMDVDVAENGLQAIEAMVKSPEGYYDAILMDVRMPIMDGITATKSIRQLNHSDAKKSRLLP